MCVCVCVCVCVCHCCVPTYVALNNSTTAAFVSFSASRVPNSGRTTCHLPRCIECALQSQLLTWLPVDGCSGLATLPGWTTTGFQRQCCSRGSLLHALLMAPGVDGVMWYAMTSRRSVYTPVGTTSQLNVASGSSPSRMLLLHGAYALKRQPSQCVVRSVSDSSPVKADFGGKNAGKSD